MGVKCELEKDSPGKSLVMWAYAPGYDASHPGNLKQPPKELYKKNYDKVRDTYEYVIHYIRNPFKSIPCLKEELCAVKKDLDEEYYNIMRRGVFKGLKKANWDLVNPPWQNKPLNSVEFCLDFWLKWHRLILAKKPDITIQVETFAEEIYAFLKDKTQCLNKTKLDGRDSPEIHLTTVQQLNTGSRRESSNRPSGDKEMQIFVKELLPKVNKPLLREVVKMGNKFGYTFPKEVVIRCK